MFMVYVWPVAAPRIRSKIQCRLGYFDARTKHFFLIKRKLPVSAPHDDLGTVSQCSLLPQSEEDNGVICVPMHLCCPQDSHPLECIPGEGIKFLCLCRPIVHQFYDGWLPGVSQVCFQIFQLLLQPLLDQILENQKSVLYAMMFNV